MKLYHFAYDCYEILTPQFGRNRNNSEDDKIIGRRCIWLTNEEIKYESPPYKYRYTVEINADDENLKACEETAKTAKMSNCNIAWYAYYKEIIPKECISLKDFYL